VPSTHAIAMLAVTVIVFYLYTRRWIRMEYVSLILLTALLLVFYVFPYDGAAGSITEIDVLRAFGHPALVAICSLMILGRGLTMTGAMEPVVRMLGRLWGISAQFGMLVTLVIAGVASAFINDTPVLVLMLPMLLSLAERTGRPASRMLMPVNFAILTGGLLTTIGTSTNLLVLSIAYDLGMSPMGLFAFTPLAAIAFCIALPYLWLVAPRLLPDAAHSRPIYKRQFEARIDVDAPVTSGDEGDDDREKAGPLVGQTLAELERKLTRPVPVSGIVRDGKAVETDPEFELQAGDRILLRDTPSGLQEIATTFGVDLYNRDGAGRFVEKDSRQGDMHLVEVVISPQSDLIGRTLRSVHFAARNRVVVVGLNHSAESVLPRVTDIANQRLSASDILLVQGPSDRIAELGRIPGLLVLDERLMLPRSKLAPVALAIMACVVIAAATKWLPIHVAAFLGVLAMLFSGCVRLDGVGRALSLEVILLVASSVALGQALLVTGAAAWVANGVTWLIVSAPPALQVAAFIAFAAVLTNFVSNAAAAAVGTPIAVATAQSLGLPVEPFVLAVLFGANLSFATPMAYQTNVLVMNAAGYRFSDFVKVGVPLVLILLATFSILLTRRYGL
jgi:di/tricarboxylate transporter